MNQQQSQKQSQSQQPGDPRRDDGSARQGDSAPRATPDGQENDPAMQGEGNRTAARRYNEETTDFVRSGRVDEAARGARPANAGEARELQQAEDEGRSHSRGEDPLLNQRSPRGGRGDGNTEGSDSSRH